MLKKIGYIFVIILSIFSLIFIGIIVNKSNVNTKLNRNNINSGESNKMITLDNWLGNYYYGVQFPHGEDEDFYYVIMYSILIYKEENNYYAKLINDGWFTETRTLARVVGSENSIDIIFIETLPNDNLYGIGERYEDNEILLTLTNDETGLQTSWFALRSEHPIFTESKEEITGIYFEKID